MAILKVDTISGIGTEGPVFEGDIEFTSQNFLTLPKGDTTQRGRGRMLTFGGFNSSPGSMHRDIQFIEIQSQGNSIDFGDLTETTGNFTAACSSSTRGIAGGLQDPSGNYDFMEFVTIATQGNGTTFGDTTANKRGATGGGSQTRGILAGGFPYLNTIDFVTIASIGNGQDFGDLISTKSRMGGASSPTRVIFAGGAAEPAPSPLTYDNSIQFVTIATTGNATDFGDTTTVRRSTGGASSETRAVFAGGFNPGLSPAYRTDIDFVTMASAGNATDFGDTTLARYALAGSSNKIRGVYMGGYMSPGTSSNTIDFVVIATTGNASDFGDLTQGSIFGAGCGTSDSHGGLTE